MEGFLRALWVDRGQSEMEEKSWSERVGLTQ